MPVPNNVILSDYRIAAFCIARVASTSIKRALAQACGIAEYGNPQHNRWFECAGKEKIWWFKNHQVNSWYVFAVIRNPFSRLVSLWAKNRNRSVPHLEKHFNINPRLGFNEFAKKVCETPKYNLHWVSQSETLILDNEVIPDYIARLENIEQDWQTIQSECSKRGLTVPSLGKNNKTDHKYYRNYYNPKTVDIVSKRYARDLEVFGYEY